MKAHLFRNLFRITLLAAILAVVLVLPTPSTHSTTLSALCRGLLAAATTLAVFGYIYFARIRPLQASDVHLPIAMLPGGRAVDLQQRVGRTRPVTSLEAQVFALAVTNPALLRPRISEVYEPSRRTIRQEVTIDVQIPRELFTTTSVAGRRAGNGAVGSSGMARPSKQWTDGMGPADPMSAAVVLEGGSATTTIAPAQVVTVESPAEKPEPPKILFLPFPAVVPIKGELNDGFEVFGIDDARLLTYSYSEYLELVAGVLRMLLLKACDLEEGNLPRAITKAELSALKCIMQRGLQKPEAIKAVVDAILALKNLNISDNPQEARHPRSDAISLVAEMVRQLVNRYAIVALIECNSDYRSLFRYRRTVVPGLTLSSGLKHPYRWAKERLSISLGSRPVSLRVPLRTAATCQSYHLIAKCPEGLYLRKQEFPGLDAYMARDRVHREESKRAKKPDVSIPPYYHARSRLGQPYAHFYSRYFAEPPSARSVTTAGQQSTGTKPGQQVSDASDILAEFPGADFSFAEVPPGSFFRGTLAAVSAFLLIWIIGFVTSKGRDSGTDAPAILLAFPAVLAGWVGVDSAPSRLLEGTLTSRLSLMGTAAFAVAASALYMIYRASVPILHGPIPFPVNISFLGISQGSWGVLAALSFTNAFYITYRWIRHTWEYKSLCGRESPLDQVIEGG